MLKWYYASLSAKLIRPPTPAPPTPEPPVTPLPKSFFVPISPTVDAIPFRIAGPNVDASEDSAGINRGKNPPLADAPLLNFVSEDTSPVFCCVSSTCRSDRPNWDICVAPAPSAATSNNPS